MIGRMKINTFTFRVSLDRAPYRKSACVFESRFLHRGPRLPHASARGRRACDRAPRRARRHQAERVGSEAYNWEDRGLRGDR